MNWWTGSYNLGIYTEIVSKFVFGLRPAPHTTGYVQIQILEHFGIAHAKVEFLKMQTFHFGAHLIN